MTGASIPGFGLDDDESLVPRRSLQDEARFDITAMIDLVFMMNIFFLVTTVAAALTEIDLPAAKHCAPADPDTSIVFTVMSGGAGNPGLVYVGEATGQPLLDPDLLERTVRGAVEEGVREKRTTVLIKAEKSVRMRDIARVAAAAVTVAGVDLKLAVIEME